MDEDSIKKSQDQNKLAIKKINNGFIDEASIHFWDSLMYIEEIKDDKKKFKELGEIATLFAMMGFYDLSLLASQGAIELGEKLNDLHQHTENLITYGQVNLCLGNIFEAENSFKKSLTISLNNKDYGNAASTTTNLALIAKKQDKKNKAIELLKKSLKHLEKETFPDTEIKTRITLIILLVEEQHEPEQIIEIAIGLFSRFSKKLHNNQINSILVPLKKTIEDYLQNHPELNPKEWTEKNFPWIY